MQGIFDNSIEVLRSHVESSRSLMQEMMGQPEKRQGIMQTVADSAVEAQERNMRFAQSTLQSRRDILLAQQPSNRTASEFLGA
jgi:hypothetical protein